MNALEAVREANLMSPRQGEWATLHEINAVSEGSTVTTTQLRSLVKAGSVESAPVEGQTMYRAAGQAIRPGGGSDIFGEQPYKPPDQGPTQGDEGYPDMDNDGIPDRGGSSPPYDPYAEDPREYGRGGPAGGSGVPVPIPLPDIKQIIL